MLCAAAALGLETERQHPNALISDITVITPQGPENTKALIDCGAQANFINQRWVKEHLPETSEPPRWIRALDGHDIPSYGSHEMMTHTTDSKGVIRRHKVAYEAVDMVGYDFILGYPWLIAANPVPDWVKGMWEHRSGIHHRLPNAVPDEPQANAATFPEDPRVEIMSPEECTKQILISAPMFVILTRALSNGEPAAFFGAIYGEPTIPTQYTDFLDVFDEDKARILPSHRSHDHAIEIQPGTQPPSRPIYRYLKCNLRY